MRTVIQGLPWLLPGLAGTVWLAWLVHQRHTAPTRTRILLVGWIMSLGLIASATLTPGSDAPFRSAFACVIERPDVLGVSELFQPSERSLNVLLFIPLGLATALLPRWRYAAVALAAGLAAPVVIELAQRVLPALGRGCQSADVVDNLTGLVIGCFLGLVVRLALRVPRRREPPRP